MSFQEHLNEKVIQFNSGARYGNVIILAGGAGSGKGFATGSFLRKENYKTLDVDEMKKGFLKIAQLQNKYPELQKLKLKNPEDVGKLHMWVKNRGLKDSRVNNLLGSIKNKEILPNIIFDITAKSAKDLKVILPKLIEVGYNPKNINLVWVLSKYRVALVRNRERERVVADGIVLTTHSGAKTTMMNIIKSGGGEWVNSHYIDGEIHVILNNNKETWYWGDKRGQKIRNPKDARKSRDLVNEAGATWTPKFGKTIVAGFTSIRIKSRGKSIDADDTTMKRLLFWVTKNAPKNRK